MSVVINCANCFVAVIPTNVTEAKTTATVPQRSKTRVVKVVNQDLSIYAKRIVCDVLIVNGTEDVQTPLKHARKMNKLIRHSNLVQTDGDHFALFYTPSAFAEVVRLFLEGGK